MVDFEALPKSERDLFAQCSGAVAQQACDGSSTEAAKERCLRRKQDTFAQRRTQDARHRWLTSNGCAAETIAAAAKTTADDGDPVAVSRAAAVPVPPEAPDSAPNDDHQSTPSAGVPPAQDPAAGVAGSETLETAASAPSGSPPVEASVVAVPVAVVAAAPGASPTPDTAVGASSASRATGTLAADGFACRRSSECQSDLCVAGTCHAASLVMAAEQCLVQGRSAAPVVPAAASNVPAALAADPSGTAPPVGGVASPSAGAATSAAKVDVAPPVATFAVASVRLSTTRGRTGRARPSAAGPPLAPGPPLRTGAAREAQLRDIIAGHGGDMRGCVERQLKLDPNLRADGLLVLEIEASGRVSNAEVKGTSLAGTQLESCLRTIAMRWGFPRHGSAYAVEAPLRMSGVDDHPR